MQNGFDPRWCSKKGASHPSDARQKMQRAPLHHRRWRIEACRRNPRTNHGREEAAGDVGLGEAATQLPGRHAFEQRAGHRHLQSALEGAPSSSPLAATAGQRGRESRNQAEPAATTQSNPSSRDLAPTPLPAATAGRRILGEDHTLPERLD
jgi:hypothetical protein